MQDLVIELLKTVNVIQLIAMGIIVWFFYSRLNEKADKNKSELKQEMDKNKSELKQEMGELKQEMNKNKGELKQEMGELKQEMNKNKSELKQEIEKLGIKVEDIDRRLCRIEGSLAIHGHCLFNQKQPDKKAE